MATNTNPEIDSLAALTAEFGRRGGKARSAKMPPEERKRIARLAAQARWGKKATAPDPTDPQGPNRDREQGPGIMLSARRRPVHATSERFSGRSLAAAA